MMCRIVLSMQKEFIASVKYCTSGQTCFSKESIRIKLIVQIFRVTVVQGTCVILLSTTTAPVSKG